MIFVPTECLHEGMVLALEVDLGVSNIPLIRQGQILTKRYINRIREMNISGVYIESKVFDDIIVKDVIDKKLKKKILVDVKEIFDDFSRTTLIAEANLKKISNLAQKLVENVLLNDEVLINLSDLKGYDDYTYCHSLSVAILSTSIGIRLGFHQRSLNELAASALLHDLGKMRIDVAILNKPDKLTEEEFKIIKEHPVIACEQMQKDGFFTSSVIDGVKSHHEKYDGSGYPEGLEGHNIPLYGRILAVADVYDALTSNRPYRKACFPSEVIEYLMASSEIQFDHEVLDAFLKSVAAYPVGTFVTLSNGQTAVVVKSFPENTLRPVVRVVNEDKTQFEDIDLLNDAQYINVTITGRGIGNQFFQ